MQRSHYSRALINVPRYFEVRSGSSECSVVPEHVNLTMAVGGGGGGEEEIINHRLSNRDSAYAEALKRVRPFEIPEFGVTMLGVSYTRPLSQIGAPAAPIKSY